MLIFGLVYIDKSRGMFNLTARKPRCCGQNQTLRANCHTTSARSCLLFFFCSSHKTFALYVEFVL